MKRIMAVMAAAGVAVGAPFSALAHTEPDLIAVPASSAATVHLQPTHGCGESPTVAVRIRAPFPDATAGDVEGWAATSTPDGAGNTVLQWTGGLLPADADGAFPVQFTAPDSPGMLLTFPAIQVCENGEELAWISGNPADEYPAPRVLVLPPGSEPATTIDEVPLDTPGREQLVAIVDVDNPNVTPTTAAPTTVVTTPVAPTTATQQATTSAPASTAAPATAAPDTSGPDTTVVATVPASTAVATSSADDGGGSGAGPIVVAAIVVAVVGAGAAVLLARRRRGSAGGGAGDDGGEVVAGPGDA